MAPAPNPRVLGELGRADAVVYGMGSLYTSIAPSLILAGVGECVAERSCPKVRPREGGRSEGRERGFRGALQVSLP